ncbi:MAG TPA: hypothetical protein PLC89_06880 [Haliscomenobacter sp.]|uniref:hypothetical protein n=1 Tax=Haliscomenobacter sp. TaxID=2717303 RepID=UPI002BB1C638|nr:hypothetical protein [Haliscomenobacter sp.]HOY16995.1 hypothetical protein [Haliscomenobacter sp.]
MKKILLSLIIANLFGVLVLTAQSTSQGMNYQAVARDASGQIIANLPISLKISLVSKNGAQAEYFSETHQVQTDNNGLFKIIIGEGKDASGKLSEVPWSKDQVWLNIALDTKGGKNYNLVSSAKLLSVPYAFHAATASQIVDNSTSIDLPTEKNQSIYWTTGGNTNTRPATHFMGTRDNQDVVFKTNNTTRVILTKEGQMQVKSGVSGADSDPASYPITVQGSRQGIYIMVNESRDNDNNFVTFADPDGIWGRIEGQTIDELEASSEYQTQVALFTLQAISLAAQVIAFGAEAIGLAASGLGAAAAVGAAANAIALGIEAASLATEWATWESDLKENIGVTYESGAGDYAEWLERKKDERDLHYGEIVGVQGGFVSLNTTGVDHYMVVSKRPIVLGNVPKPEKEQNFEKVAFMGQVPVKVVGAVAVGDYIIPSGNNDGLGAAIHPADMKLGDYAKIVGVAWQAAKEAPINYVNVAVGINTNDLTRKVDELNQKVEQILAYLEGKAPLQTDGSVLNATASAKPQTTFSKLYSDEEFDQMVDNNADFLTQMYAEAKVQLIKQGYDANKNPKMFEMLDNPLPFIKEVRRNPAYITQWAMVDQKIKSKK